MSLSSNDDGGGGDGGITRGNDIPKRSGCPVKHSSSSASSSASTSEASSESMKKSSLWVNWFRQNKSMSTKTTRSESCPIQTNASFASIEEAAKHAQTPHPDQTIPLSTHRTISTIPKGSTNNHDNNSSTTSTTPSHQPANKSHWVYPSEQQFFNAMKRKGWELPPGTESTIPFVVQIHNAVNEKGWKEIQTWENLRYNHNPKLVKFIGRPQDLSPKARIYSFLWLRKEPFDRHDWYVSREDGSDLRRYVIDFYNGKETVGDQDDTNNNTSGGDRNNINNKLSLPSMYLDVRPALDDSDAALDRLKMSFQETFPGIASVLFKRS